MSDHAAEAQEWIIDAPLALHGDKEPGGWNRAVVCGLLAQAEATLALVEQQRLANLIALANGETRLSEKAYFTLAESFYEDGATLLPEIAAALGMEP